MQFKTTIIFICFIISVYACKNSSIIESNRKDNLDNSDNLAQSNPLNIPKSEYFGSNVEKITNLEKVAEIKDGFSNEEYNFFADISDITIDGINNLFVADSKLHKIFKFNEKHEFVLSFGREGQGPGEFAGRLKISAGNDGNIYVSDHGNYRFLIFSSDGILLKQFPLPKNTYDRVIANSKGEMYLYSESGFFVLDRFNSSFHYIESFFDLEYMLEFPIVSPPKKIYKSLLRWPLASRHVHKLISAKDILCIVFNNSHIVICMDQNKILINQFRIEHPRLINDVKKRLQNAKKNDYWINTFGSVFFDNDGNVCLCYYNSKLNSPEIYRYRANGKFLDTLRIPSLRASSNRIIQACDNLGNYYGINQELPNIAIYKISHKSE